MPNTDSDTVDDTAFLLGSVEVRPDSLLLIVDGKERRVEPRMMDLLVYGSERHGRLLSKEAIMADVWRGAHVVPEALQRVVSLLRKALGDSRDNPAFLETVSKKGYRFLLAPQPLTEVKPVRLTGKVVRVSPLHLAGLALALVALTWLVVATTGSNDTLAPKADVGSSDPSNLPPPPPSD